MRLKPARFLEGRLRLPGDKSISHRAALIAALADGRTEQARLVSLYPKEVAGPVQAPAPAPSGRRGRRER